MAKVLKKQKVVNLLTLLKDAFNELSKNDPLRMAGATAFFTTFALPPILVILTQTLGLIFNPKKIRQGLLESLSTIVGNESVNEIMNVLLGFSSLAQNWFITIGGFIFLLFVATTLFKIIKGSLNQLWKIKVIRKRNFGQAMRTRIKSIMVILVAGILFVLGLVAEGFQAFLGNYIKEYSPLFAVYFDNFLNYILSIAIVTLWFSIVFRFLPDARPDWNIAIFGAFVTSILFNSGKFLLRHLLTYSNINTLYGASGSIVLLLLFVFYSSLILYYGAAFTKVWGIHQHQPIKPMHYAIHYQLAETDEE